MNYEYVLSQTSSSSLINLILAVIGAFGFSILFGYIMYQCYDNFQYPKEMKNMIFMKLMMDWVKTKGEKLRDRLDKDEVLLEMLINYGLYAFKSDKPLNPPIDTLRGYWSHLQARTIGSFVGVPAFVLSLITFKLLSNVEGLLVFNADRMNVFGVIILVIIAFSVILWWRTEVIRKQIGHLVCLILRHNHDSINEMLDKLLLEEEIGATAAFKKEHNTKQS